MKVIENQTFDMERALYGCDGVVVKYCSFDGPADGESAFKESRNIEAEHCFFNLRYPFWHDDGLTIRDSEMTQACRAALWYSKHIQIMGTKMHGIKALRECSDVMIENCDIISPEFGWSVRGIQIRHSTAQSEYFMMRSENLTFEDVQFKGKYSFQYIRNATFVNCVFDTKDAFWHSEDVTVRNSVVKGEYLAWYSEGLTLVNCKITGTQPLCYCKNLKLVDCEMIDTDLAFEKSQVEATVTTPVVSIKNPLSGQIHVPEVGEMIMDDENARGKVITGRQDNCFVIDNKKVVVYPSAVSDRPVVYLNTFTEEGSQVYRELCDAGCPDFTLVTISGLEWNHDMAPWDIPPVSKGDTPCTGGADGYLRLLTEEIVPRAETLVQGCVLWRGLAGYSLAGLFALYSVYRTGLFSRIASVSGSLWFPGFKDYVFSHEMKNPPEHLYLSLGDKECKTRNPYLKTVKENTEEIKTFYMEKGIDTGFQSNPGNHYTDTVRRTAAGIAWILGR